MFISEYARDITLPPPGMTGQEVIELVEKRVEQLNGAAGEAGRLVLGAGLNRRRGDSCDQLFTPLPPDDLQIVRLNPEGSVLREQETRMNTPSVLAISSSNWQRHQLVVLPDLRNHRYLRGPSQVIDWQGHSRGNFFRDPMDFERMSVTWGFDRDTRYNNIALGIRLSPESLPPDWMRRGPHTNDQIDAWVAALGL